MRNHAEEIKMIMYRLYRMGKIERGERDPTISHADALAAERDRWKRAALAHQQDQEYEDAWADLVKHGDFKEIPHHERPP